MKDERILLSFLDVVCAAVGAAVVLFLLFTQIGSEPVADPPSGRFLMASLSAPYIEGWDEAARVLVQIKPPARKSWIDIPQQNFQTPDPSRLQSELAGSGLVRMFYSDVPALRRSNSVLWVASPQEGCWRFRLVVKEYRRPRDSSGALQARSQGRRDLHDFLFKVATHADRLGTSTGGQPIPLSWNAPSKDIATATTTGACDNP